MNSFLQGKNREQIKREIPGVVALAREKASHLISEATKYAHPPHTVFDHVNYNLVGLVQQSRKNGNGNTGLESYEARLTVLICAARLRRDFRQQVQQYLKPLGRYRLHPNP